jgi:DNA processing protein
MLNEQEFAAWFRLLQAPGLSRTQQRKLLSAFGSLEALWDASPTMWRDVAGPAASAALLQPATEFEARLAAAWRWRCEGPDRRIIAVGDAAYPAALLHSPDPPLVLYAQGQWPALNQRCVAVVGSRSPTPQGWENARAFSKALALEGYVVVSGLAMGIDAAAHEGALEGAGSTVAVLGHGLDTLYPRKHHKLAERITKQGLLLSEYAPGTPALAPHFPQRNRIIAGLSMGTLVVEAALKSGSLITARLALEAGREVMAVPGSIHSLQAQGCHALLKQGAALVETVDDILLELGSLHTTPKALQAKPDAHDAVSQVDAPEDALLQALGHDPIGLDALVDRTGMPVYELGARLLELELMGQVSRLPGGLYARMTRA